MKPLAFFVFILLLVSCGESPPAPGTTAEKPFPADHSLRDSISAIIHSAKAHIGVAIIGPDGDTLSFNGDHHFPMMSVAKFPQALALLHMVDEGKLSRDTLLRFTEADMKQRTFSKLQEEHPQKEFTLSIPEALHYSIGQSDNITSNVIFAMEGGPQEVEAYLRRSGITDIGLTVDYRHLNDNIHGNWSTPKAMAQLLENFYNKKLLADSSQAVLWNAMVNATSGPDRLKGLLPAGTIVAHKTGTGGTDDTGTIVAFNDVGIVGLPGGKHFSIAVFVADSKESEEATAGVIARISKAAWDNYRRKN